MEIITSACWANYVNCRVLSALNQTFDWELRIAAIKNFDFAFIVDSRNISDTRARLEVAQTPDNRTTLQGCQNFYFTIHSWSVWPF